MIAGCGGSVRVPATTPAGPHAGLWTIVLAAGGARRFGSHKLAVALAGRSLLRRAVDIAREFTGDRCVVVLGAGRSRLAAQLHDTPARLVVNRHWREGMSTSLSAGVAALPRPARAALILLADQYAVGPGDVETLLAAWSRHPRRPAAAEIAGQAAAPAVLPRAMFREVHGLRGDRGARALLRRAGSAVTLVAMPRAARDLDERRDLGALRRHRLPARR